MLVIYLFLKKIVVDFYSSIFDFYVSLDQVSNDCELILKKLFKSKKLKIC